MHAFQAAAVKFWQFKVVSYFPQPAGMDDEAKARGEEWWERGEDERDTDG